MPECYDRLRCGGRSADTDGMERVCLHFTYTLNLKSLIREISFASFDGPPGDGVRVQVVYCLQEVLQIPEFIDDFLYNDVSMLVMRRINYLG